MKLRLVLQAACEFLVVLVMLVTSVVEIGSIGVPTAHAALHPPDFGATATGGERFSPDLSPASLPVSAWYAPHGAPGQLYGPFVPGTSTLPQGRQPGEQADLRTAASDTILNPDGTWTLKAYPVPINYQDAQGNWQPIDNTLIADMSDAGYAFGNRANEWHVHFASQAGGPSLVDAQFPQVKVAETLNGAAQVPITRSGPLAVYPGVFPAADLRYGIGTTNLEETLLLHTVQAPASYTFTYHIPGASVSQDEAGNVLVTDAKGTLLLVIGGILMYEADAQGQMLPTSAVSEQVQVTLSGTGPDFQVTYTPNHAWLTDPKRHFPVAIDPTWQASDPHTNTTSGNIYADTFDESGNATQSFYTVNAERIGNADAPGVGLCCNGVSRAYLKFPINPAPTHARVTSANLKLYQYSSNSGGNVQMQANAIMSAWNATTLTWNNHPTSFETVGYANTSATANTWVQFDVSAAAQEWWSGGIALNGLEIQYTDETKAQEWFISEDNTANPDKYPILTINYAQDNTTPGGALAFNSGATATNNPAVTVAPAGSDTGSTGEWSSDWHTVNGVGTTTDPAATWSIDGTHAQLIADSSSCGSSLCFATTFFTHTLNVNTWPTITAMVKADNMTDLNLGVVSGSNMNTRFDVTTYLTGSTTAFTKLEVSTAAGSYSVRSVNVPFTPNTWYYVQIIFPLPNAGELYVWPIGQTRPSTPSAAYAGLSMTNPGLYVMQQGDNGANLHHVWIGNVQMTSKAASGTGYGIYGMQLSSDNWTTSGCPNYAGGAFSGGPWCVYSGESFPWTFSTGDGIKKLWWKYVDNAGNVTSSFSQVILDTTAPTVSSITLANGNPVQGSEVRGVVTLAVNGSDPPASDGSFSGLASALLYVDGVQMGTGVTGTSTPTLSLDTTNLPPGVHTLTVKLIDAAGNTGMVGGSTKIIVSNTALMPYETLAKRTLPDGQTDVSVNVANGDTVVTHQDLDVPGRGPNLALGRTYHALTPQDSLFGFGWTSDLDESLSINADGSRTYRDANGGIHVFLPNGSGGYLTSPGLYLTLVQNGDGTFTLKARDQSTTNFTVAGLLSSLVDRNGNTLSITYSGLLPTTVTDAAGRQYTITITSGHVTQINAPGSRVYHYSYDGSGNLSTYTDPTGVVTRYEYDSSHRMTKITLNYISGGAQNQETNVATTLTYDTNNRLAQLVDPLGFDVGLTYSIPAGGSAFQTQVAQLQVVSPATYETTTYLLTTDGLGAVAKLTDALNNATQYQYDANENVTQVTDPIGHVSSSTYNSNGMILTHVMDPGSSPHLNLTTTWTYDSANNILTLTDPRGIVTKNFYDGANRNVLQVIRDYVSGGPTNSDTNVSSTATYDSYGEMLTQTDPLGIVTRDTYDTYGDMLSTAANYIAGGPTDSQTNVVTSATYDVLGERLNSTDPLGIVTTYGYDILGHLLQTIVNYRSGLPPDSQTNVKTMYGYDPLGRQVTVTNPLGVVTLTIYDKDGRATSTTENSISGGAHDNQTNVVVSTLTYDAAGNVLTSTDAQSNVTVTVYDPDNRAVQVTDPDGHVGTSTYDGDGNLLTHVVDPGSSPHLNQTTTWTYNNAGRQATQTDPPASSNVGCGVACTPSVTTTTYDADGNLIDSKKTNSALVSPSIVTESTSTFDKLNHLLTKTAQANTPAPQTTTYTYDLDGRQTQLVDPAAQTTITAYDALGRILTVTHPGGSVDTYTYDAMGEQLSEVNSSGTTTNTYDPLGRVLAEGVNDGGGAFQSSVTYTYDAEGNKLQEQSNYPGPVTTIYTWTYDPLNRPRTMSDGARSYTYDSNGNVLQIQVLNPSLVSIINQTMTYDGQNRVSTLGVVANATNQLHQYTYTYNAVGERSQISDSVPGTTLSYTYDNLMQLLSVQQGSTSVATYTYDANGNRATMVTSAGTTSYSYDSGDVTLLHKTDPDSKVTDYTYDSNGDGNLKTVTYHATGGNQVTSYSYDTSNRLTGVTKPDGTQVAFTYDANGNRVSKAVTTGGTTTTIKDVYALGHLIQQTDGSGTILATFTYDVSGQPASVVLGNPASGPRYYYAYNAHGDVVALTDSSGNVVASYAYDAFGALTSSSESFPSGWTNPFRYVGSLGVRYDAETGLYWMGTRAYNPSLGRFLERDPLGLTPVQVDTPPYVYAGNDPINAADPTGMLIASSRDGGSGAPPAAKTTMAPSDPKPSRIKQAPSALKSLHSSSHSVSRSKSKPSQASPQQSPPPPPSYPWVSCLFVDVWLTNPQVDVVFVHVDVFNYCGSAVSGLVVNYASTVTCNGEDTDGPNGQFKGVYLGDNKQTSFESGWSTVCWQTRELVGPFTVTVAVPYFMVAFADATATLTAGDNPSDAVGDAESPPYNFQ